ncbi:MAG: exo-beta-N-acetylmuramidase NamZ domain-containing protein, partial [Persicimonas sp.]
MKPRVQTGLDRLLDAPKRLEALRGARVGLLANPTSVTYELDHAIDALAARGVKLERLFGPEHGVRAEAQDMESVHESVDPISGIPTVSLYGSTYDSLRPKA